MSNKALMFLADLVSRTPRHVYHLLLSDPGKLVDLVDEARSGGLAVDVDHPQPVVVAAQVAGKEPRDLANAHKFVGDVRGVLHGGVADKKSFKVDTRFGGCASGGCLDKDTHSLDAEPVGVGSDAADGAADGSLVALDSLDPEVWHKLRVEIDSAIQAAYPLFEVLDLLKGVIDGLADRYGADRRDFEFVERLDEGVAQVGKRAHQIIRAGGRANDLVDGIVEALGDRAVLVHDSSPSVGSSAPPGPVEHPESTEGESR